MTDWMFVHLPQFMLQLVLWVGVLVMGMDGFVGGCDCLDGYDGFEYPFGERSFVIGVFSWQGIHQRIHQHAHWKSKFPDHQSAYFKSNQSYDQITDSFLIRETIRALNLVVYWAL